jgi:hypothetical protein
MNRLHLSVGTYVVETEAAVDIRKLRIAQAATLARAS